MSISFHLITTADERTWKFDRPVIFLGEWCRLYERKHIWKGMNAIVAPPYGLGQTRKDADYAEARAVEERLFPSLCNVLNDHHGAQHGARFWRIVLGHWFRRYVDVMVNRSKTLQLCLQAYSISGTTAFAEQSYGLAPRDSREAIDAFNDDRWNHELYLRILALLKVPLPMDWIDSDATERFLPGKIAPKKSLKSKIADVSYKLVRRITTSLVRSTDALIINSYLPKLEQIKFNFYISQIPQSWATPKLVFNQNPDFKLRQQLARKLAPHTNSSIDYIIQALVFEQLPICYLEGFDTLEAQVSKVPWPSTPKFIFTSNNFDTDETFKLWTARKVELGYKYVVGQHGNNYGTLRYMWPTIEEATADKFLTWGWSDGLPQHTPAFILKTAGRKSDVGSTGGGLLLVEVKEPHRITVWDSTTEFAQYFLDQLTFVTKLSPLIRAKTTVRLHGGHRQTRWAEVTRWRDFDKTIQLDLGASDIRDQIAKSRLVIHSYDSTGILETLAQNIPTLAFWQNGLAHLRESAKPYYQLLVEVGIVHLSPESAATKVHEIWNDVEGWWNRDDVRVARFRFCAQYAKVSNNPAVELCNLIQNNQETIYL